MVNSCVAANCTNMSCLSSGIKLDFHSAENVARSTFCDRFLLKCVESSTFVPLECSYFKTKRCWLKVAIGS